MSPTRDVVIMGSDAGGTMTDMILVDKSGDFVVGKAATTPHDQSRGFMESIGDAFERWDIDFARDGKDILPGVLSAVYSGTAMLNALLTRTGQKLGVIITKGFEDTLLHERGAQNHAGYGYQDKIHFVAHAENTPLVPKRLIRGVTERTTVLGEVAIPVYEHEARQAVADLLDRDVEGIAILFLYSYLVPGNERKVAEIARQVMKEKGKEVALHLSCDLMPIWRECSRLNAVVLQGSYANSAREQLLSIEQKLHNSGYEHPLQIVLADGGIANIRYPALFKATFSGPIGGLLGGKFLCQKTGIPNLVCTDMGGTSFDVGLIMGGEPIMLREVEVGRIILNLPTLSLDSIGAGAGQYVAIEPESGRIDVGPGSAGADPGPVCYNMGNPVPTVMDCVLILGILNPDYYLGGKKKLRKDMALAAIKKHCSDPLGIDPYRFAEGVINLINVRMKDHITTVLAVRGYSPADYYVIGYGGAGPLFLAGYTDGLPFKGVFTVPWAAAFSAFGCCAGDYLHKYQRSIAMSVVRPEARDADKLRVASVINTGWEELERIAIGEMQEEGFKAGEMTFKHLAYVRYTGQLEDVEVVSPVTRISSVQDMDRLRDAFEATYTRMYSKAARYPEVGYQIMEIGIHATVPKPKPRLRKYPLRGKDPPGGAYKGERKVYIRSAWKTAKLYEMDLLENGNEIQGLTVIEAPSTTLLVPEGKKVVIDQYKRFWLQEA